MSVGQMSVGHSSVAEKSRHHIWLLRFQAKSSSVIAQNTLDVEMSGEEKQEKIPGEILSEYVYSVFDFDPHLVAAFESLLEGSERPGEL
jgi:hypothetical protein